MSSGSSEPSFSERDGSMLFPSDTRWTKTSVNIRDGLNDEGAFQNSRITPISFNICRYLRTTSHSHVMSPIGCFSLRRPLGDWATWRHGMKTPFFFFAFIAEYIAFIKILSFFRPSRWLKVFLSLPRNRKSLRMQPRSLLSGLQ